MDHKIVYVLILLTFLTSSAYASVSCTKTPLGAGTPPATERLICKCGQSVINYTAVAASKTDPCLVQFKDLSKGNSTYICWAYGVNGKSIMSTNNVTNANKNPVYKFPKTGYYISGLTLKCKKCSWLTWVHMNIVIKK